MDKTSHFWKLAIFKNVWLCIAAMMLLIVSSDQSNIYTLLSDVSDVLTEIVSSTEAVLAYLSLCVCAPGWKWLFSLWLCLASVASPQLQCVFVGFNSVTSRLRLVTLSLGLTVCLGWVFYCFPCTHSYRPCTYQAAPIHRQQRLQPGGFTRTQPHQDGLPVTTYVPTPTPLT